MTKAKAATVTGALINAGYKARADELGDGSWFVVAHANEPIGIDAIKAFQDAQSVTASAARVIFN